MIEKCSALQNGKCKNGFWTNAACSGIGAGGCPTCGQGAKWSQPCMKEEVTGRTFHRTGGLPPVIYDAIRKGGTG